MQDTWLEGPDTAALSDAGWLDGLHSSTQSLIKQTPIMCRVWQLPISSV